MNDVCVNVAEEIASDSFVNPQYDPNQLEMVELTDLPEISSFGDHINQEGLKYIAGYVAHRFRDKYSNVGSMTGNVTGKRPDWLSCISKGNLLCPSEELLQATGLMHHEFIPEGRTVTKELYVETLRRLWDAVRRKRPEKWVENNWFLMHDNAPAHRAIIVKNFLARHNITALDHPPYSPDLSPPDYFLFPRLKSHLKGRRFNAEEVIANATRALRRVSQNGFQACFQELYTRWQK
ncbi:hypothetical protein ANN_15796 [Periplaneta americana]|uniref:Mariner Mos1 transposase n=1 Tax=Periplaneta americana TaxID=6978 RepID=A0ABQ8SIK5_PERAM|nr:hypothetical protein ANN_15796 [Periplaneta americana]